MLSRENLIKDLFSMEVPVQFERNSQFHHYGYVCDEKWKWSENIYNAPVGVLAEMVIDLYKYYLFSRAKR